MACRRLTGPSSFAPSNILPAASTRKPLSLVRHAPTASKFSRAKPMGSISLWQDEQAGLLRCSSKRSRTDKGLAVSWASFNAGTFGSGGGGGGPLRNSQAEVAAGNGRGPGGGEVRNRKHPRAQKQDGCRSG